VAVGRAAVNIELVVVAVFPRLDVTTLPLKEQQSCSLNVARHTTDVCQKVGRALARSASTPLPPLSAHPVLWQCA
jgi:hypothetical protein